MIEQVRNQNLHSQSKVTGVEKVSPSKKVEEVLTKPEKQSQQGHREINKEKMEEVLKGINEFLIPVNTSVKFILHEKLNDYYVNVVDDRTQEVIKEIPSKRLLDTYASMMEFVGLLVDKKI